MWLKFAKNTNKAITS